MSASARPVLAVRSSLVQRLFLLLHADVIQLPNTTQPRALGPGYYEVASSDYEQVLKDAAFFCL